MPYKSKAQMRKFFAMEAKGELPKGKAEEWAEETKDMKHLPERKGKTRLQKAKDKLKKGMSGKKR